MKSARQYREEFNASAQRHAEIAGDVGRRINQVAKTKAFTEVQYRNGAATVLRLADEIITDLSGYTMEVSLGAKLRAEKGFPDEPVMVGIMSKKRRMDAIIRLLGDRYPAVLDELNDE